tara:strand:+ start:537 stop:1985 length:1449 start_codon:yes stop_codon:yes gene_type:complete
MNKTVKNHRKKNNKRKYGKYKTRKILGGAPSYNNECLEIIAKKCSNLTQADLDRADINGDKKCNYYGYTNKSGQEYMCRNVNARKKSGHIYAIDSKGRYCRSAAKLNQRKKCPPRATQERESRRLLTQAEIDAVNERSAATLAEAQRINDAMGRRLRTGHDVPDAELLAQLEEEESRLASQRQTSRGTFSDTSIGKSIKTLQGSTLTPDDEAELAELEAELAKPENVAGTTLTPEDEEELMELEQELKREDASRRGSSGSRRSQGSPSGSRRTQRSPSGSRRSQGSPSRSRRSQGSPSGSRRTHGSPSGSRRTQRSPSGRREQQIPQVYTPQYIRGLQQTGTNASSWLTVKPQRLVVLAKNKHKWTDTNIMINALRTAKQFYGRLRFKNIQANRDRSIKPGYDSDYVYGMILMDKIANGTLGSPYTEMNKIINQMIISRTPRPQRLRPQSSSSTPQGVNSLIGIGGNHTKKRRRNKKRRNKT